jgi:hypothetical protein
LGGTKASRAEESDVNTAEQSRLSIPKLRADIAGAVVGPGDPGYDAARRVFLPAVQR